MAIVWLPRGQQAYPEAFATRAEPGTANFFYLATDALHSVYAAQAQHTGEEPWGYLLSEQRMYAPAEIESLREEWQRQFADSQTSAPVAAAAGQIDPDQKLAPTIRALLRSQTPPRTN